MKKGKKIGLSLSGGGYRATIYHLGTIRKIKEMNLLDKVDVISTISGGSITGAYYGLKGDNFDEFDKGLIKIVKKSIIKGIYFSFRFIIIIFTLLSVLGLMIYLLFTDFAWVSTPLLLVTVFIIIKYQFKIFPVSRIINKLYAKWFFENKNLKDFNKSPLIAINATNVETGRPFTFSKNKMSDSSYEFPSNGEKPIRFIPDEFPISLAVASSTCVPFAFTPIYIEKKFYQDEKDFLKIKPCLVDGGVYDNQGVHKLTHGNSSYVCDIVIVSDAGDMMPRINSFNNIIQLLVRTSDIFMNRIKNYQMIQHVYDNYKFNKKSIAYQSLGWDFDSCIKGFMDNLKKGAIIDEVIDAHEISRTEIKKEEWELIQDKLEKRINYNVIKSKQPTKHELSIARSVTTNLKALKDNEIESLIKQAASLTEIQIKLYCPILID
ncbi:MAG TPA: patatin-like phospholipase family protein [Flavobacterium sp.]|uniref:patatin-like phospholipase family protein n=1 Tax=Flavobacterium sp. TaxID=239 RepID=UPI002B4AEEB6|nr:patatin-like phospholipase family protein [Flavobacterium sp.]HLO73215.1 patatin-like phospholipase family protein [Flavobacterium sp.]